MLILTYKFLFGINGMNQLPQGRQIKTIHCFLCILLLSHKPVYSFHWHLQRQTDVFGHFQSLPGVFRIYNEHMEQIKMIKNECFSNLREVFDIYASLNLFLIIKQYSRS